MFIDRGGQMTERDAARTWEFRPHWGTLVPSILIALIGVIFFKLGRDFLVSRQGVAFANDMLRALEPAIGPEGVAALEEYAEPGSILILALLFGAPLLKAWVVRATTCLAVDDRQILFRRGIIARDITQVEIGEIVGVNVYESVLGRLLGYGRVDIETRGEDRLVMDAVGDARGFAGLVLDIKHRLTMRA
jgi:PH (Pleckstrin Homology) domain-containing protein